MPGYIKLYRELQENPIWQKKPYSPGQAWTDIIFRCNHVCKKVAGFADCKWVLRGQFISSNYKLAEAWGWSESSVRQFIKLLISEKMITALSTRHYSVFEVTNYCVYQSIDNAESAEIPNAQKTHRKRTGNAQKTPNNNDNNDNNEKNKEIYTPTFETTYKNFPRPQAKSDTFKNWNSLLKQYTEDQLFQFAENYRAYYESIPETDRPFPYSSNNFFGKKAYYLDFIEPKKWEGKTKLVKSQTGPPQKGNFEQRQYNDEDFEKLYKE